MTILIYKINLTKFRNFISGNVCCSAYPIEQMDSINSSSGELQTESALNLIVFGVSNHSKSQIIYFILQRSIILI